MRSGQWRHAGAEHQGINLPGAALSIPALTAKDRNDLEFGLERGVDMVALSFVRSAADVRSVKQIVGAGAEVPVIAKLEKPQALNGWKKSSKRPME